MISGQAAHFNGESSFLWNVLCVYFKGHSVEETCGLAALMWEQEFEFSRTFEDLLLKLLNSPREHHVIDIAKAALRERLFHTERHILLISLLVATGKLRVPEALPYLDVGSSAEYANLDKRVQRVIDVAWLILEDSKDGLMKPVDDSLLEEVLNDAATVWESISCPDYSGSSEPRR